MTQTRTRLHALAIVRKCPVEIPLTALSATSVRQTPGHQVHRRTCRWRHSGVQWRNHWRNDDGDASQSGRSNEWTIAQDGCNSGRKCSTSYHQPIEAVGANLPTQSAKRVTAEHWMIDWLLSAQPWLPEACYGTPVQSWCFHTHPAVARR